METTYQVTIKLPDATISALAESEYILCGFSSLVGPPSATTPIWFQTTRFSPILNLAWTNSYAVYVSAQRSIPNGSISAFNPYTLQPELGQTLTVDSNMGIGELSNVGQPGTVTVVNKTDHPFTCGLAAPPPPGTTADPNPALVPISAFHLYGNNEVVITPGTDIFLIFATGPEAGGPSPAHLQSGGVLVPLSPTQPTAELSFDINLGWTGGIVSPSTTQIPMPGSGSPGSGLGTSGSSNAGSTGDDSHGGPQGTQD